MSRFTDAITKAYSDVLKRDPDQGGLAHYIKQAEEGRSVQAIRSEMAGSKEYKSRFGDSGRSPSMNMPKTKVMTRGRVVRMISPLIPGRVRRCHPSLRSLK